MSTELSVVHEDGNTELAVPAKKPRGQVTQLQTLARPMSKGEKERIEKLVNQRADMLVNYVAELRRFATEATEQSSVTDDRPQRELQVELDRLDVDLHQLDSERDGEVQAACNLLKASFTVQKNRLQRLMEKLEASYDSQQTELRTQVNEKYRQKRETLVEQKQKILDKKNELAILEASAKLLKKAALSNSFNQLAMSVEDRRHTCVEQIWTAVETPTHAAAVLNALPDGAQFRRHVSAERLYDKFEQGLADQASLITAMRCVKCQSTEFTMSGGGTPKCKKCGRYADSERTFGNVVVLPSLDEIASEMIPQKPSTVIDTTVAS